MVARRAGDRDEVGLDLLGDMDLADLLAEREDPGGVGDRLEGVEGLRAGLVAARDRPLAGLVGIADPDADEEPVELRLGQGEGALELDRVLGREDEEWVGAGGGSRRRSTPGAPASPRAGRPGSAASPG